MSAAAISVDVDNTLYRVRRLRVAWRLRHARGLLLALVAAREKLRREDALDDADALMQREAELVAPGFGISVPEALAQLADLHGALPEALTRNAKPYPGVRSALEAAHARGLKLCVLSDFAADEKLHWLGLDDLPWAVVIGAEQTGALKPQPKPFLRVAELAGVAPGDIVHIGDREDSDVRGALGAGMRAWRFSPKGKAASEAEVSFRQWGVGLFSSLFP